MKSLARLLTFACGFVGAGATTAFAQADGADAVKALQNTVQEWIKVEKQISAETSAWAEERVLLEQTIQLLRDERAQLEKGMVEARESASEADKKREELAVERDRYAAVSDLLTARLVEYENAIRETVKGFPSPLMKAIRIPLSRIPTDPEKTTQSISSRMQNIVGILVEIDKFNLTPTKEEEVQRLMIDGKEQETTVTTVYLGLGAAYYVDSAGQNAGYLDASNGWKPVVDNSLAPAVAKLVSVMQDSAQAAFVGLPVSVK